MIGKTAMQLQTLVLIIVTLVAIATMMYITAQVVGFV